MSRRSKHHTEEFKAEAVALVESSGKSVPEIAARIGQQPTIPFDVDAVGKILTDP